MNLSRYSVLKSLLNSWHYNGFAETLKLISALTSIKLKLKNEISVKGVSIPIILRNGTSDLPAFRQIFMDFEYLLHIDPKKINSIVDGGCNIGLASIYFSTVFPAARIIAIEPDEKNFVQAELNLKSYKQVRLLKAALWGTNALLKTEQNSTYGEWGISVSEADAGNTNVKALTIDSIMAEFQLKTIDLLKLDIEGAELELFNSASLQWIPKVKILLIELHDHMKPGCAKNFFNSLSQSGIRYSYYTRGENVVIVNEELYNS